MPQRGPIRASRQVIVSWTHPGAPAAPVTPTPAAVVGIEFYGYPLGSIIHRHGFADSFPVLGQAPKIVEQVAPDRRIFDGQVISAHGFANAFPVSLNTRLVIAQSAPDHQLLGGAALVAHGFSEAIPPAPPIRAAVVDRDEHWADFLAPGGLLFNQPEAEPPEQVDFLPCVHVPLELAPPWPALLAGSWISGAGCFEVRNPPILRPGPRTKVVGADMARTKVFGQGRTTIVGEPLERSKIRSYG